MNDELPLGEGRGKPMVGSNRDAIRSLLHIMKEKGKTIADCVQLLGRTKRTLKRHAKREGLDFPDYKRRN